jgi:hypothetical protein
MTFRITTLSIMTLSITHIIATFSIMTLSITDVIATFSIMALGVRIECNYAEPTSSC